MPPPENAPAQTYTRIVLTGAAGWLGTNMLEALRPSAGDAQAPWGDAPLRAVVRPGEKGLVRGGGGGYEIVEADIRDAAACAKALEDCEGALVIHTAGIIHPALVRDFWDINATGGANVAQAAAQAKAARVVAMSSNSPCGVNPKRGELFDHSSPPRPYLNYGRSKLAMENSFLGLPDQGVESVVVRAPWFYGPYQPARQSLFFRMVRDGGAPIVGDGENLRSMTFLGNLAEGMVLAGLARDASGVYWIADAEPYTTNQIVDTIEKVLEEDFGIKCKRKRLRLPNAASAVARSVDATLQAVGLYHAKFHVLGEMNLDIACSIQRSRDELGYAPKVALQEGMRRSIAQRLDEAGEL